MPAAIRRGYRTRAFSEIVAAKFRRPRQNQRRLSSSVTVPTLAIRLSDKSSASPQACTGARSPSPEICGLAALPYLRSYAIRRTSRQNLHKDPRWAAKSATDLLSHSAASITASFTGVVTNAPGGKARASNRWLCHPCFGATLMRLKPSQMTQHSLLDQNEWRSCE